MASGQFGKLAAKVEIGDLLRPDRIFRRLRLPLRWLPHEAPLIAGVEFRESSPRGAGSETTHILWDDGTLSV